MKILVTGANGQLGSEIQSLASKYPAFHFIFTDLDNLDIKDYKAVENFVKKNKPEVLINCAAYNAVDKAEEEGEEAMVLNAKAVKNLAELSTKQKFFLVHISTDFVFDGKAFKPYTENDTANPLSVYAKSKFDGEIEIIFNTKKAVIIRTSWLYSSYGHNFVKTILRLAKAQEHIQVIYDQIGTPTYAADLAKALLDALPQMIKSKSVDIYNYANEGAASWYDFAKAIVKIADIKCNIKPIEGKEFNSKALRPHYSVLNKARFKKTFNQDIPHWYDSLELCLKKI